MLARAHAFDLVDRLGGSATLYEREWEHLRRSKNSSAERMRSLTASSRRFIPSILSLNLYEI